MRLRGPAAKTALALIAKDSTRSVEYLGFLTNHALHALVALSELQRPAADLERWYAKYESKLRDEEQFPLTVRWDTWEYFRGVRFGFPSLRSFLRERMEREGCLEVLRRTLPKLADGVGCAAFHGLIHTGYALRTGHDDVAAHGLAYWIYSYSAQMSKLSPHGPASLDDFGSVLSAVANDRRFVRAAPASATFNVRVRALEDRMAQHLQRYNLNVAELQDVDGALAEMKRGIAALFIADGSRSFFLLHGITAADSLQVVFRVLRSEDDALKRELLAHFWHHVLLTVIAEGCPTLPDDMPRFEDLSKAEWAEAVQRCYDNGEEHLIKLAFVADQEGDTLFKTAARNAVHNVEEEGWKFMSEEKESEKSSL